jgi:hypothetical protein
MNAMLKNLKLKPMKKILFNKLWSFLILAGLVSSCILEDVEPEYKVVGAVATVATITPSKVTPVAGETITVRSRYYSEKEPVTELRLLANVGGGGMQVIETRTITGHVITDSYEATFNYTVPADASPETLIILRVEATTSSGFSNGLSTPSTGASRVRVGT